MRIYSGVADGVAVGTDKTVLTLISATPIRPELIEFFLSCNATPADLSTLFHLERFTAVGTEGSGFTPHAIDPISPAADADYGVGVFSAEPTYTANAILWSKAFNQRNTLRWAAVAPGAGFIAPATANNGLGLQSQASGGTAGHNVTFFHAE